MSYPMPQKSIGLLEEAARMARLNHPNIVKLIAVSKLCDFGLPIDFGPRLPIPWLPPEIVCSLDQQNTKHRPESDVWMFGVLCWECATLGAEP
uniref:Protein kinase domain-containing protein n=1 Tax=Meloidogyne javanica TaxID=6303 RepID=A0A915MIT9_MELJA